MAFFDSTALFVRSLSCQTFKAISCTKRMNVMIAGCVYRTLKDEMTLLSLQINLREGRRGPGALKRCENFIISCANFDTFLGRSVNGKSMPFEFSS